jgi:hypothetical protein
MKVCGAKHILNNIFQKLYIFDPTSNGRRGRYSCATLARSTAAARSRNSRSPSGGPTRRLAPSLAGRPTQRASTCATAARSLAAAQSMSCRPSIGLPKWRLVSSPARRPTRRASSCAAAARFTAAARSELPAAERWDDAVVRAEPDGTAERRTRPAARQRRVRRRRLGRGAAGRLAVGRRGGSR